ncbi:hypothetical protein EJ03DRAFT_22498 [Teratosphaeria nubilosa]|uniref:Uncharacterized protein n=1 Tax=Teratosphaeria nubilosa TaxID=161662 RepID=A0A6G1LFI8_9PEZI|nr:hypothetical protein EJ03DRAFT_22498 [Teratosphaeria nubilosa]
MNEQTYQLAGDLEGKLAGKVKNVHLEPAIFDDGPSFPHQSSLAESMSSASTDPEDARMRKCWEEVVRKELGIPNHYSHVAVLMVYWAADLDKGLNVLKEVKPLEELFKNDFGFTTEKFELKNTSDLKRPQLQLDKAMTDFVHEHDGSYRTNLLIVYYTGHGCVERNRPDLLIAGTSTGESERSNGAWPPRASWAQATRALDGAEADVLTILDCCCAGNMIKVHSQNNRIYEIMAATGKDMATPEPGVRSYTLERYYRFAKISTPHRSCSTTCQPVYHGTCTSHVRIMRVLH